jgi:hypothetical protein
LPHHDALCAEYLQRNSCPACGYQIPTRKTMPVVNVDPVVVPSGHELQPYKRVVEICYAECKELLRLISRPPPAEIEKPVSS